MQSLQQLQRQNAQQVVAPQSSRVSEDAFDAMRQAAMNMFRQRTKDLTCLSKLQQQQQVLEQQLREVQDAAGDLQRQYAELESAAQSEEQRTATREAQLKDLHYAMRELSTDHDLVRRARGATTNVSNVIRNYLEPLLQPDSRLLQLLTEAQQRTGSRSASDFRTLSGEMRRRTDVLATHLHNMQRSGVLSGDATTLMMEWSRGNWMLHAELRGLCQSMESSATSADVSSMENVLSQGPVYDIAFDEEAFVAEPFPHDANADTWKDGEIISSRVDSLLAKCGRLVLQYTDELHALAELHTSLSQRSEDLGVSTALVDACLVKGLQENWTSFSAQYGEWLAACREVEIDKNRNAALRDELTEVLVGQSTLSAEIERITEAHTEAVSQMNALRSEQDNYVVAWHSIAATIVAQQRRHSELAEATAATAEGLRTSQAAFAAEAAQHDEECATLERVAQETEEHLKEAQAATAALQGQVHVSQLTLDEHEAALEAVHRRTAETIATLRSLFGAADGMSLTDPTDTEVPRDNTARGNLSGLVEGLSGCLTAYNGDDLTALRTALTSHHDLAPVASLPEDVLSEFCRRAAARLALDAREEQHHHQRLCDADAEIELLELELNAE